MLTDLTHTKMADCVACRTFCLLAAGICNMLLFIALYASDHVVNRFIHSYIVLFAIILSLVGVALCRAEFELVCDVVNVNPGVAKVPMCKSPRNESPFVYLLAQPASTDQPFSTCVTCNFDLATTVSRF